MKRITPNIFVQDIQQTIGFYEKLGFELTMSVPDEGDTPLPHESFRVVCKKLNIVIITTSRNSTYFLLLIQ